MTEKHPLIIAILNTKGGVGKTTTAVNLGAAFALSNRRVLLVDLDSQASASAWCGIHRRRLKPSAASVLLHDFPVEQAIRRTATPNLDLITGSLELVNTDLVLADVAGRELVLKQVLQSVRVRYDVILLDCPPSFSLLTINALVATDAVIVPVPLQPIATDALDGFLTAVEKVGRRLGSRHRLRGILITMASARSRRVELRARLRTRYRDRVFQTEIPLSRMLQSAPAAAQTIFAAAPRSRAAASYRQLSGELLERLGTMGVGGPPD